MFSRAPVEKLLMAAEKGDLEGIKKLLEGKTWPAKSPDEVCESFMQIYESFRPDLMVCPEHQIRKKYLTNKRRETIEPEDIYRAYREASWKCHLDILKYLMQYNIQLDFAFEYAAGIKDIEFLRYLIQSGANKEKALLWSGYFAVFDIAKELVEAGADVNTREPKNGNTVLLYAACAYEEQAPETTEYLIGKGADIHAKNYEGNTLLHEMASPGAADYNSDYERYRDIDYHQFRVKTWQVLKKYITDLNPRNNRGFTPLDYADDYIELFVDIWVPLGAKRSKELI
jgi:hypothetical protein